jgi:hypothetical protein
MVSRRQHRQDGDGPSAAIECLREVNDLLFGATTIQRGRDQENAP